jgi:hypothetical protein
MVNAMRCLVAEGKQMIKEKTKTEIINEIIVLSPDFKKKLRRLYGYKKEKLIKVLNKLEKLEKN